MDVSFVKPNANLLKDSRLIWPAIELVPVIWFTKTIHMSLVTGRGDIRLSMKVITNKLSNQ